MFVWYLALLCLKNQKHVVTSIFFAFCVFIPGSDIAVQIIFIDEVRQCSPSH
jgi:hypothetical protein